MTRTSAHRIRTFSWQGAAAVALTGSAVLALNAFAAGPGAAGQALSQARKSATSLAVAAPAKELALAEAAAIALFDQSMNVLAGVVDERGCVKVAGRYPFAADVLVDGSGRAQLGSLAMNISVEERRQHGTRLAVHASSTGEVAGIDVVELAGSFSFSRDKQLVLASSTYTLADAQGSRISYDGRMLGGSVGVAQAAPGPRKSGDLEHTSVVVIREGVPTSRWQHAWSYDRVRPQRAYYRSVRERSRYVGSAPCSMVSHEVVAQTDADTGQVRMYGSIELGPDKAMSSNGPQPAGPGKAVQPPEVVPARFEAAKPATFAAPAHFPTPAQDGARPSGNTVERDGPVRIWGVGD